MDTELHPDTVTTELTPPVDVLVSFESPIGIIRNCRSALALLSAIRLDTDSPPTTMDVNMGHWILVQSIRQALEHAEKLLMAEAQGTKTS
ncbi:MAG: hypothetical protein EKK71_15195 [Candidatus Competibacteraceae bacterium]|nr:MAG: hypothetical protein EKK71_15195 [Candidatus Competibacteraceae bacterium]